MQRLGSRIESRVWDRFRDRTIGDYVWVRVWDLVRVRVEDLVRDRVGFDVRDRAEDRVRVRVRNRVGRIIKVGGG